jgi:hypothetical protein
MASIASQHLQSIFERIQVHADVEGDKAYTALPVPLQLRQVRIRIETETSVRIPDEGALMDVSSLLCKRGDVLLHQLLSLR